jgi:hypothetical protein
MTLSLGAGTSVFAQKAHAKKPQEAKAQAADQKSATDKDEDDALNETLKNLLERRPDGLKTTTMADGTVMVELTPEFMEVSVIKINPDGSQSVECVSGMKAAEESLKSQGAGAKADSAPGAPAAGPAQKATTPPGKGETGKTPQKTSQDKSKWEVM